MDGRKPLLIVAVLTLGVAGLLTAGTAADEPVAPLKVKDVETLAPSLGLAGDEPVAPLDAIDYEGLTPSLSLDKSEYVVGEPVEATIKIESVKSYHRVCNAFFGGLRERPGRLRIFDASGKFVTQLLDHQSGSWIGGAYWTDLREGCFVGARIRERWISKVLPPGEYKMQLVLYRLIVEGPPKTALAYGPIEKQRAERRAVIAASSLVWFRIVDKGSPKAPKAAQHHDKRSTPASGKLK